MRPHLRTTFLIPLMCPVRVHFFPTPILFFHVRFIHFFGFLITSATDLGGGGEKATILVVLMVMG